MVLMDVNRRKAGLPPPRKVVFPTFLMFSQGMLVLSKGLTGRFVYHVVNASE